MDLTLFKHVRRAAWVAILSAGAWVSWHALSRGLWLDEAWLANSVLANSLQETFWGGEWLQTSAPLFLVAARMWTAVFGMSTEALRALPLAFAALAAFALAGASRTWAPFAVAALLFPVLAVEYFTAFKQYGAEAAAAAITLWAASEYRRVGFAGFCAIVTSLLPLAYSMAFLVPGAVWFVWRIEGWKKAAALGVYCAGMLGGLYLFFIRPNVEPSLWSYWNGSSEGAYSPGVFAWAAATVALLVRAVRLRKDLEIVSLLPCLLLIGAELLGWYPASPRTRMFIRPCFILALVLYLQDLQIPKWVPSFAAIVWATWAVLAKPAGPLEDYPAAVQYLTAHVGANDLLLVHPNAREGLRLYGPGLPAAYGSTGWPCCLRGRTPQISTEATVREDLARLVPPDYRGTVWLFYANRPLHWEYIGLNEGELWRKTLWKRGCPPGEYVALPNLVISPMICRP